MKYKIIFLLLIIISFVANCKEDKKVKLKSKNPPLIIKDFDEFIAKLKEVVNNRDIEMIDRLASDKFKYKTPLDTIKNNYTREEAIENFDFDLVIKLLKAGIVEDNKGKSGYAPPIDKMSIYGYAISFWNDGNGWKIISIYQGPSGKREQ